MGEMSGPNITKLHSPASAFRPIQNEKPTGVGGKELLHSRLHDRTSLSPKRQRRKSETDVSFYLFVHSSAVYQLSYFNGRLDIWA